MKPLHIIWSKFPSWSRTNTLAVDDLERNFVMNPESGIVVDGFYRDQKKKEKKEKKHNIQPSSTSLPTPGGRYSAFHSLSISILFLFSSFPFFLSFYMCAYFYLQLSFKFICSSFYFIFISYTIILCMECNR